MEYHKYETGSYKKCSYQPNSAWVNSASAILPHVKEVISLIGLPLDVKAAGARSNLPQGRDIVLYVRPSKGFEGGAYSICTPEDQRRSLRGYSKNKDLTKEAAGFREAFVKEGRLPVVLGTAFHELGHLATPQLPLMPDEEAKAYAMQYACAQLIAEGDIAGLGCRVLSDFRSNKPDEKIWPNHLKAYNFVLHLIDFGWDSLWLHRQFSEGSMRVS